MKLEKTRQSGILGESAAGAPESPLESAAPDPGIHSFRSGDAGVPQSSSRRADTGWPLFIEGVRSNAKPKYEIILRKQLIVCMNKPAKLMS
jgi:hypothetical protein